MDTDNIIRLAIENLEKNTGIRAKWIPGKDKYGTIEFFFDHKKLRLKADIKNDFRIHQMPSILNKGKPDYQNILIIPQLYPGVKTYLRELGISYLEANGNIFLKTKELLVFIDSQEKAIISKAKGNRAFTKTGLKVLFNLLRDRDLVNRPHRHIAEITGVALGNIPPVIAGLREKGYLLPLEKRKYVWENRKELLERWITGYDTTLKPSLHRGRFRLRNNWKDVSLNRQTSLWGGEPAGDLLTGFLRPEKFILYTKESNSELIKNYKLIPDEQGEVWVYQMFWNDETPQMTTPAILVYADLVLENDKRCTETAQMIYDEHIRTNL